MGAWARAGWRVWDLGNGTIMLQKFFNPEWQITSKSFLLSSFLIGFSFFSNRGNFQARTWVWRKFGAENRVKEGIGQESNGAANQEKQIFLLCQISPSASSTRDLGTRLPMFNLSKFLWEMNALIILKYQNERKLVNSFLLLWLTPFSTSAVKILYFVVEGRL